MFLFSNQSHSQESSRSAQDEAYRAGVMATFMAIAATQVRAEGAQFRLSPAQARQLARLLVTRFGGRVRVAGQELDEQESAQTVRDVAPSGSGPFEITLLLENDNLIFGGWALMAGRDSDGTDLGRTHATQIIVRHQFARGIRLGLDVHTQLFTRAVDPARTRPQRLETLPVHFHELNTFLLRLELNEPSGGPWGVTLEGGVVIQNREVDTWGASGQQQFYHSLLIDAFNSGIWRFEHVPDGGGIRTGAVFGFAPTWQQDLVTDTWIRLRARASAGMEFNSIVEGNHAAFRAQASLEVGRERDVRLILSAAQEFDLYLFTGQATGVTRGEIRFATVPLDLWLGLNVYELDANNPYFFYNFPNTTMTSGLTGRFE